MLSAIKVVNLLSAIKVAYLPIGSYLQLRQGSVVSRSQDVLSALVPAMVDDNCDGEMAGSAGGPASDLLEALGEQVAAGAKVKVCRGEDLQDARQRQR